ncbi:hypothetical protein MHYP_G00061480 [Metynnis hypsauchen]
MVQMDGVVEGWWMATMSQQRCDVSKEVTESCFGPESWGESCEIIFMHDNAPSHAAKSTSLSLAVMGIKGEKLMVWPPSSPDFNPVENLWSILKQKIYQSGRLIQTAALGCYSDILQRNSSRNSPKTHKFNGCKNCEGDIKEGSYVCRVESAAFLSAPQVSTHTAVLRGTLAGHQNHKKLQRSPKPSVSALQHSVLNDERHPQ